MNFIKGKNGSVGLVLSKREFKVLAACVGSCDYKTIHDRVVDVGKLYQLYDATEQETRDLVDGMWHHIHRNLHETD